VDEIEREAEAIAGTGLKHILLLTGESRTMSSMAYLKSSVQCLSRYFSSVAIEIYPLDTDEYRELIVDGVDAMTLYQETYNRSLYDVLHVKGPKKNFAYRLDAPGRACDAGMRSVNIGALLGLDVYHRDLFLTGLHAWYLMKTYPDTEISVSFPRMRPHTGSYHPEHPVSDREFVQILTAMRLFLPRAGITISTREAESFRNNILPLGVTKMSAGSCTAVGGRTRDAEDIGQFEISDERSVDEMVRYLGQAGYQPVFKDWHPI
jgi:2-iminoacetate synthase